MGNLRAVLSVSLLSIAAACGGGGSDKPDAPIIHTDAAVDTAPDSPPPIDAPSYDFSCLNNTAPTTAPATVTVSGTAQEITLQGMTPTISPSAGVAVKACKGNCTGSTNNLGTTTSAANGDYATGALTTGGTPLDGFLDATKTGDRRTLLFPPNPLNMNLANAPLLMFNAQAFGLLNQFLLSPMQDDTANGIIGIAVTDCMNTPITTGATVVVKQNGVEVTGGQTLDLGALAAQAAGTYMVTNVPAGPSEVSATVNGMTMRAHTVTSVAGATTATSIRPGF
jgi:hypothetical protein